MGVEEGVGSAGCNLGMRCSRRSPAQTVAAASSNKPAIHCSLHVMVSVAAYRTLVEPSLGRRKQMDISISGSLEMAIEEIACRMIARKPVPVQQKIMHVIRENELFDFHAFFAQPRHEVHRLREVDVAYGVTMNKKHGRFPCVDGGHG